MAKRNSTRAARARSSNSSQSVTTRSRKGKALTASQLDSLHRDLLGVLATVVTARAALGSYGLFGQIALSLVRGAENPIERALQTVKVMEGRAS